MIQRTNADESKQGEAQETNPVGRPLAYQTVEELDLAIQNYFAECDPHTTKALVETGRDSNGNMLFDTRTVLTEQKPYTMAGLARALGISRQTLLDYGDRPEFLDSIANAKQRCEEYAEGQLYGPYANGAKFNLINNYRGKYQAWADKQELTGGDGAPLMPIGLDAAILTRRAHGKTPPSPTKDSGEPS